MQSVKSMSVPVKRMWFSLFWSSSQTHYKNIACFWGIRGDVCQSLYIQRANPLGRHWWFWKSFWDAACCWSYYTVAVLSPWLPFHPFRLLCILVQTVREMVAFALLSTGCCSQAMVLCSHFPFCSIRLNRMSCHHPSCLWYIVNQVQFLLGFLALCRASHKTRRDTKTLKSQVLTLPLSWLFCSSSPILSCCSPAA